MVNIVYGHDVRNQTYFHKFLPHLRRLGARAVLRSSTVIRPRGGDVFWKVQLDPRVSSDTEVVQFAVSKVEGSWSLDLFIEGGFTRHNDLTFERVLDTLKPIFKTYDGENSPEVANLTKSNPTIIPYPHNSFQELVKGKEVAVVGSAASLGGKGHGARIDQADLVMRLSHASQHALDPEDYGSRTDIWCINGATLGNILQGVYKYPQTGVIYSFRNYANWTPKEHFPPLVIPPFTKPSMIHATLGTILVDQLLQIEGTSVYACGMDFFRTSDPFADARGEPAVSRPRVNGKIAHHMPYDEAYLTLLRSQNPDRFKTDTYLGEILDGKHPR